MPKTTESRWTCIQCLLSLVALACASIAIGMYPLTSTLVTRMKNILPTRIADITRTGTHDMLYQDVRRSCPDFIWPMNSQCPRVLSYSLTPAGLGHQFTEFLFGLRKARMYGLAYIFEPFAGNSYHKDDYAIVNDIVGLPALFLTLGGAQRDAVEEARRASRESWQELKPAPTINRSTITCDSYFVMDGFGHCQGDCFKSPESAHLFQDVAQCLRTASTQLGSAFRRCIFAEHAETHALISNKSLSWLPTNVAIVVWHIRLGDITLHSPDDEFYRSVLQQLRIITRSYKVTILLVGKGSVGGDGTSMVGSSYVDRIRENAANTWSDCGPSEAIEVLAPRYNFRDAFLAMMQADILVGSGSSLPAVASLVSGIPLFFNHVAKHGYNFGAEMTTDSVDMEANGTLRESLRRLTTEVNARLHPKRPTACRKAASLID